MTTPGVPVELYIYDLTNGLASVLSPALLDDQPLLISKPAESDIELGMQIEGVWHTAIVIYEREYFYGGHGITSCTPGSTMLGRPHQIQRLGTSHVPFQMLVDYLQGLSTSSYTPSKYHLLTHNCNHFSDELAQFLCGQHVPKHIVRQPQDLSPALLLSLKGIVENLVPDARQAVYSNGVRHSRRESPDYHTLNHQIEEARQQSQELEARRSTLAEKLARKERRKEKKRKKANRNSGDAPLDDDMAEAVEAAPAPAELSRAGPSSQELELEEDERRLEEQRKRNRDPPIVYTDVDGPLEFEKLSKSLEGVELSVEERQSLEELQQYLVQGEGSWVLGDEFLAFIGRLLNDEALSSAVRESTLRALASCALRDDVSLLLHQDRRHHALLNYAHSIDRRPVPEQLATALVICNLFENVSSSEWLLYISEWEHNGQPLSNIRVTTKVCVHCALSEEPELREVGTALMHNVATKEVKTVVFDEVCVELGMALLQLLQSAPCEEHLFRACKALARLAQHCAELPQLVAIVGPDPAAFRGTSPRIDEQIDLIMKKMK